MHFTARTEFLRYPNLDFFAMIMAVNGYPRQYTLQKTIENRGENFSNFTKNVRNLGIFDKINF